MFGIDDAIANGASMIKTIVDKIAPDANIEVQGKITAALQEMQNTYELQLAQLKINEMEAGSANTFASSWRPTIGYICAVALAYSAIIEPFARFIASVGFGYMGLFPVIDTNLTFQILTGMLGLAGMRSYDKLKGTAK